MNKLYELSDDPHDALDEILGHYGVPDRAALHARLYADVVELLADDLVEPRVTRAIDGAFAVARAAGHRDVHGPLGLYLALDAATRASLSTSDALREEARQRFEGEAMLECFHDYYGLDAAYDLSGARLHAVGTTSLIVKCRFTSGQTPALPIPVALKCVLPRFLTVKAILKRTEDYARSYKTDDSEPLPCAPYVFRSTQRTIAMEFVKGDTLARRLDERAVPDHLGKEERARLRALDPDDIAFLRKVAVAICRALSALADVDRRHLDLSPSNIIITGETETELHITFIDFGHNFAITDRAGSSAAFRRASLYVAPELFECDRPVDDWRCDAYSLGVILLAIAAKREIHEEDVAGELDRLWKGDDASRWDGVPGLARVVEELIDRTPDQRLALWGDAAASQNPYRYIEGLVRQECQVLDLYEAKTDGAGFGLLRGTRALVLRWRTAQITNLLETKRAIRRPVDESYEDYPRLATWGKAAIFFWGLAVTLAVLLTLVSLRLTDPEPWLLQLADAPPRHFAFDDFANDLLGRIVAATFALTAVTYYVNCLSTLSPKRLGTRIGWTTEFVMRAIPFALAVPVVATMFQPSIWALAAGIGTSLVALNNFLALRVATEAEHVGARFSTRTAPGNRFIMVEFRQWWSQILVFSIALIAIGVLSAVDVAKDAAIYAVLAIVTNTWKVYRLNCIARAPELRGSLARDILTLRRAERLEEQGVLPPQEAVSPEPHRRRFAKLHDWWWEAPARGRTQPAPAIQPQAEPTEP